MNILFPNQGFGIPVYKHTELPILKTFEFDFYRCVEFSENLYNKTVSELHNGNLRLSRKDNRYSELFPNMKLSYWADSRATAKAEVVKWGAGNNILTFEAYDDASSFMPTTFPLEELEIVDGVHLNFSQILTKLNTNTPLNDEDMILIQRIIEAKPDCIAYKSEARKGSICFLFFEKGFKKLSLKSVSLRLGDLQGKNYNKIICANTCDYLPILESYGEYFEPKTKMKCDQSYKDTEEYRLRQMYEEKNSKIRKEHFLYE